MSAWRHKAIEAFPELHTALNDAEEIFSPYALWFELLPMVREAHRSNDVDLLTRIYTYAAWSSQQAELSNAVATSFYEHLFDEQWMRPLVPQWLSPHVVENIYPLWQQMLAPDALAEVDRLFKR